MSIEKLDLQSPDKVKENFQKLAELFPNCVTESAEGKSIDFDLLKQELKNEVVEGNKERYRLEWPGKREAIVTANLPTTGTLRPIVKDSVDFDNTENLYIEGDNLEVLKLLQESYLGKIKMIYIDPPYNTGEDFIYLDNFIKTTEKYKIESGQVDEHNLRLFKNPEISGRYHSDWLTMMYPRLKLARNLLTEDGFIFIQIDENEVANLRKVCDEIFGEGNYVNDITIKMSHLSGVKMSHVNSKLPKIKETILFYAKKNENLKINKIYQPVRWDDSLSRYTQFITNINEHYKDWNVIGITAAARTFGIDPKDIAEFDKFRIDNAKSIFRTARNRSLEQTGLKNVFSRIITPTGLEKYVYNGEEVLFASEKLYNIDGKLQPANSLGDIWTDIGINNLHNEGEIEFRNGKKPLKLIRRLINLITIKDKDSIILDFFSGSATTAHAVMQLNAEDGSTGSPTGKRKFIMVQIPQLTEEDGEAYKAGYKNICEIGKERIRRAGKKIKEGIVEAPNVSEDEDSEELDFPQSAISNQQSAISNQQSAIRFYRYWCQTKIGAVGYWFSRIAFGFEQSTRCLLQATGY